MQLNKEQIKALSGKIWNELSIAHSENEKKARESIKSLHTKKISDIRKKALKYEKEVRAMNADIKKVFTGYDFFKVLESYGNGFNNFTQTLNNAENWYYNNLKITNKILPTREMISNDIILETIECENLEQIINKIKNKYK